MRTAVAFGGLWVLSALSLLPACSTLDASQAQLPDGGGVGPTDAGTPPGDGGVGPTDSGTPPADGGAPDAGPLPLVPNGQFRKPDGGVHAFIGGNYTDLGMVEGQWVPSEVTSDLQRLKAVGVDEVRIWARHLPGLENLQFDGQRVNHIATEAARLGMTISVDLFDGVTIGGQNVNNYRALEPDFVDAIEKIVKPNAGHRNIQWSVGNEPADPWRPLEFADWYVEKVAQIRAAGGPGTQIIAELLPGSVNHPWASATYEQAAKRIVNAVDVVAIHYYPPNVNTPAEDTSIEHQSIVKWNQLARAANRPFVIGEFNIHEAYSSDTRLRAWLQHFHEMRVDHVSFWQFLKNEGGHVDPWSFDEVISGHNRFGAISMWMNKLPLDNGL